jgi:hypothetical protein
LFNTQRMKKFLLVLIIALTGLSQNVWSQTPFYYGSGSISGNCAGFNTVGTFTGYTISGDDFNSTGSFTWTMPANPGPNPLVLNFRNFTLNTGHVLTISGINSGPVIIRCTGICTINGSILAGGGAGGVATSGSGGTNALGGSGGGGGGRSGGLSGFGCGSPGSAGNNYGTSTGRGLGGTGTSGTASTSAGGGGGASYGVAGTAGTSGTVAGGAAGTIYGDANLTTSMTHGGITTVILGGCSGGGGGGNGAAACGTLNQTGGGGGGGGGGAIQITATQIVFGANALIRAKGGAGGNGLTTPRISGSGGGGSGGTILLQSLLTPPSPTVNSTASVTATTGLDISGGLGGTVGRAGGNGGAGRYLIQQDGCTPTTQATGFSSAVIDGNTLSVGFTRGNGSGGVIIVARTTATTAVAPTQLTSYSTTTFGSGTIGTNMTGTGNYIVYNGTGNGINTAITPINVGGLTTGVSYSFDIYERSSTNCYNLVSLTGSNTPSSCTPPGTAPTSANFTAVGANQVTLNWTNASTGNATLIVVKPSALTGAEVPVIGTSYTTQSATSIAYNAGQALGSGYIAYNTTVTPSTTGSLTLTGLSANTTYYVGIYSYDNATACYNVSYLPGSQLTLNPMTYTTTTVTQVTNNVAPGTSYTSIIGIQVVTGGGTDFPLQLNSLTFNTTGTTNVADLTNARVYSTGTTSTFSTGTQLGSTVSNPSGSYTVTPGTAVTLSVGTNYFWIAYDVSSSATLGNVIDAECTSVNISGTPTSVGAPAPAGSRTIANPSAPCSPSSGASACALGNDFWITAVSMGTLNYTGGTCLGSPYYLNTGVGGIVSAGQSYTLSVSKAGTAWATGYTVWIDWNNNGTLNDAGEQVMFTTSTTTPATRTVSVPVPSNAVIGPQLRMRVRIQYNTTQSNPCATTGQAETKDFYLVVQPNIPMEYVQTDVTQASTATVTYNTSDWEVLRLNVKTIGALTPLVLNQLAFNTTGTTNATDILAAKLWKTNGPTFTSPTQVGATINTPSGALAFSTLNQTLTAGDNYYWLTYRISPCAVVGNVIDAQATGIVIGSSTTTPAPSPTSPTGTRTIVSQPTLVFFQDWDTNNSGWSTPLTSVGPPPGVDDYNGAYNIFVVSPACNYTGNGNSLILQGLGTNCSYWADINTNIVSQSANINTSAYSASNGTLTFYYDIYQNGFDLGYDYSSIYYSINGGTSWTLIENVLNTNGFVENHTFNLPAAAFGITNLRFRVQFRCDAIDGQDPPFLLDNVLLVYTPNNPTNVPNLVVTNPPAVTSPATVNITVVPTVVTDNNNTTGTYAYYPTLADAQAGTNPLATPTAITTSGTYYIKKTVTATGCSDIEPVVVTINVPGPMTWTGALSTNWDTPGNWTPSGPPTAASDITIPNVANDPTIFAGTTALCKDITVTNGTPITFNAAQTLTIAGNWSSTGSGTPVVSGPGKVIFASASPQTITNANGATFSTLQINNSNGVTVATGLPKVNVTTALELKAGTLTTNGNLVTVSTALKTAYIDDFSAGNTGTLSGNVAVERYITNGPNGYRYIGAPVATTAGGSTLALSAVSGFVISGTPGQLIPLPTCNPNASASNSPYGTFMRWEEAGPFMYSCRQAGWWFQTTGTMTIGRGYGAKVGNGTKITYTGAANTGAKSYGPLANSGPVGDGWHLVSNPYPSTIVFDDVPPNAISTDNMPTGFGGQIQLYQTSGPYTGSYLVLNSGVNPAYLSLGQGFWVRTATSGTFALTNNHRVTNAANYYDVNFNRYHLNVDVAGNGFMDKTDIYFFGDAETGFDFYDAEKWDSRSDQPTIYTKIGNVQTGINSLPSLEETVVVPMGIKPGTNGNFTFTFDDIATFPQTALIYLEDLQLGTMTDLRANNSYNFTADVNDNADRFMLHFQPGLQAEVADQDCDNAGSIELTQPAPTVWSTYEVRGNDNNVYAQGTNFTGSVTVSNLPAQEYVVTVTHPSGYSAQEYITVNGSTPVNATINASATNVMVDEMVSLTATANNATEYVWNFGDGNTQSGSANVVHAYDAAGTYNVTVTASGNVCDDVAGKTIIVGNTTGITGTQANTVSIYGQGERVVIEFNNWGGNKADIFMYNALGQRIESLTGVSTLKGRQELYIADIIPGTYFIQVVSDGKIHGQKVFLGKH